MEKIGDEKLYGGFEEKNVKKISIFDHINEFQYTSTKSDSFVVDMEQFSHIIQKDINSNSRISLQRNLSRKGSLRNGERKTNSNVANDKDNNLNASSPRVSLLGGNSTPEKAMILTNVVGTTNDIQQPTLQTGPNPITIVSAGQGGTATAESKVGGKRFSFRRSSSSTTSWTIDPRRILFFFATLSSMGTILLIYFTLSMAKLNGEDNVVNE